MKFTIVIPSFNQAPFIRECIESVLLQDLDPAHLEVIVLDGGSTDGSVEIIREYESRLAFWRSAKDGGQTAALIEGFGRATGDILAWVNSDDFFWSPGVLSSVARAFERNPDADLVCGDLVYVTTDRTPYMIDMVARPTGYLMRHNMVIAQPATFWRRTAYERAGGLDPSFNFCMDWDLFQRMSRHGRIVRVPEFAAGFRMHPGSKTSRLHDVCEAERRRCLERSIGRPTSGLWGKVVNMHIRLASVAALGAAVLSGRKLPVYAHARIGPMVRYARRKHGL